MTSSSRTLSVQHSRAVTGTVLAVQVRDTLSLLPPTTLTAASPNLLPRAGRGSSGERALSQHSPPRCSPSPPELTVSRCYVQCKRMPLKKFTLNPIITGYLCSPENYAFCSRKMYMFFTNQLCIPQNNAVRLRPHPCVPSHQLPFLRQVAVTFLVARSGEYLPLLRL